MDAQIANKHNKRYEEEIYSVDLTNTVTPWQVVGAFVDAKVDNGIAIEPWELEVYSHWNYLAGVRDGKSIDVTLHIIDKNENKPTKKPNIFKKFWNWLTGKNK